MRDFYKKWKEKIPSLKIIIAPHEFDDSKKEKLIELFSEKIEVYSTYTDTGSRILFLDRKGNLKFAYRYADIAFIGGGFQRSVHNVAEAAVYGIPVLFGPAFEKFEEINELAEKRLVFSVDDFRSFENILSAFLGDTGKRTTLKEKLTQYFNQQNSASETIVLEIYKQLKK
jgi:3-deoxy-D-manno-octulosonic-acid transferase